MIDFYLFMCVWIAYFLPTYFIIQFIFGNIHGFYYTFWYYSWSHYIISTNIYLYLQYVQQKVFSFSKISKSQIDPKCVFGKNYFFQIILLFNLFLLLFMGPTVLFDTIYESHDTISTKFYFYLQYFQ